MKKFLGIFLLLALLGSGLLWNERVRILEYVRNFKKEQIPLAITFEEVNKSALPKTLEKKSPPPSPVPEQNNQTRPSVFNLSVPFTSQAPHGNWDQPYQDACEEAALAMVHYFYAKKTFTPEIADREMLDMIEFEERVLGYGKDTTAEETAEIAKKYYGYNSVEVIANPTVEIIKDRVAKGYPVISPAYGRALGNPYFTAPGPIYHMLVIKGYTEEKFITNDPGTKRGADYLYNYSVIMDAMHDWNNGDVEHGRKVIIVIHPN